MVVSPINANQHYAASLAKMGLVKEVIAAEDICDESGTKLWAKGKPIDARLWERLSDRALQQPLESSVSTADPLDQKDVLECLEKLLSTKSHYSVLVKPKFDVVLDRIKVSQFNSAELMMFTLLRHGDRDIFEHACAVAAAAVAMGAHSGLAPTSLDKVLHGGMLHDVGEIYVDPSLFSRRELSIADQRQLLMHPSLGALVSREILRCSVDVAHTIEQSHERLDGAGYPAAISGNAITPLSMPVLAAEAIIGLLMAESAGIQHAAIALRLNPGEFPQPIVALVNEVARATSEKSDQKPPLDEVLKQRMINATERSEKAVTLLTKILRETPISPSQRTVLTRAEAVVRRCVRALNSTGLAQVGHMDPEVELEADWVEAQAATREIEYRLGALIRDIEIGFIDQRKPEAVEQLLIAISPPPPPEKSEDPNPTATPEPTSS